MPLLIKTKGKPDPGAMGNDALIMRHGHPIAGMRDAKMDNGEIYGAPLFRQNWREFFKISVAHNITVQLTVSSHELGEISGWFEIVTLDEDKISLRPVSLEDDELALV